MKRIFIILCLLLSINVNAQEKKSFGRRLSYSLEWGYSQTFFNNYKYNIISAAEGYRLGESGSGFQFYPHLRMQVACNFEINNNFTISLVGGNLGIAQNINLFPLMLRLSIFNKGLYSDGFFSLVESGYGFHSPNGFSQDEALLIDLGEGYRIKLSRRCCLDFLLQLSYAYCKPPIANPDGPGYVLPENILSNYSEYFALNFMIRINI